MKVSRKSKPLPIWILSVLLLAVLAGGCVLPAPRVDSDPSREHSFVPPTLVPTLLPTADAQQQPTRPANCIDRMTFISDVTVPDGTVFAPKASIDKRWEVENNGTCSWTGKYTLRLVAGPDLGVRAEQALLPARSGTRATIRILFTAPEEPGTYRSAWQAYTPEDQPFGDTIYIEIVVQ